MREIVKLIVLPRTLFPVYDKHSGTSPISKRLLRDPVRWKIVMEIGDFQLGRIAID